MEEKYGDWEKVRQIEHSNPLSSIWVRIKDKQLIIEKRVKITDRNADYVFLEIETMQEIKSPHVVRYLHHTHFNKEQQVSLYMPFYQNGNLQDYLTQHPQISFQQRVNIFIDILAGLKELHSRLIIHRDLKLQNIFVDSQGRCVVGDLGIAAVMVGSKFSQVGTIPHQAPQVYSNNHYDSKVDVWTTGILAYQLFNPPQGRLLPFPFNINQQTDPLISNTGSVDYNVYLQSTSEMTPFDPSVPKDLAQLITRMLQNDPEKRINFIQFYQSQVIQKYNDQQRLDSFLEEYRTIAETKTTVRQYAQYLRDMQIRYFDPINSLLGQKELLGSLKKYPFLKKKLHELHIFFYLQLKRALEYYEFMRGRKVMFYVREFKIYVERYKNACSGVETRINLWLREHDEEEIDRNEHLLEEGYYDKLKIVVDQLLGEVSSVDHK